MMIEELSQFFTANLSELAHYLFDANKRIYFLYLLSAVFLAIPVFVKTAQHKSFKSFFRFILPWKIYSHNSARQDYVLWVVNKLLKAALFAPVVITMVPIALGFSGLLESVFGVIEHFDLSQGQIIAIFTLALFVVDDFTRFLLHYLLHKIPFLWEFHKVHHSAKVLTPFTIYRSHPVESYLYACRMALTQGIVVGAGYYLFGPTLKMFDVLGANLFVFAFNIMGSNLRHSHIWLSWGDKIEGWFISPAQHQVHHSDNPKHFDTNLGSALAIWDRLAGCLIKGSEVGQINFGVGKNFTQHDNLAGIYFTPFQQSAAKIVEGVKSPLLRVFKKQS